MYRTQTDGRKQIRLADHDYASSCVYFVTICVDWRVECLGCVVNSNVVEAREPPLQTCCESYVKIKSLTELVGAFKTTSSKLIHQLGLTNFMWQRSFHDRVINNLFELDLARAYIQNNPKNWHRKST